MLLLRPRRLSLVACLFVLIGSAAAQTANTTAPPAGQAAFLTLTGRGVQIYTCKQAGNGPAWIFVAPDAKLEDSNGAEAGTHSSGPTWSLKDGSTVQGKVKVQQPSIESDSIPWLLLEAHDATGALKSAQYIRRSDTHGGKVPSTDCDAAHLGQENRVPYTATYTFYAPVSR